MDIFHDPGYGKLRHLLAEHPYARDYVGVMKIAEDQSELPDTAFADQNNRTYPVDSKEAAAISFLYAREDSKISPLTMGEIKTALQAYNVPENIFQKVIEKVAAAPEDCVFPEKNLWPIRTAGEVKEAVEALISNRDKLLPESRVQAFGRIYKKAQALGMVVPPIAYRYVGATETDSSQLRDSLRARAEACSDEFTKKAFLELSEVVMKNNYELSRSKNARIKLASAVDELDQRAGLRKLYDRGLPDPLLTVFNTEKRSDLASIDVAGRAVSVTSLMKMGKEFFSDALGDDIAQAVAPSGQVEAEKLAEILPTLPRDSQRVLSQALRSAGV